MHARLIRLFLLVAALLSGQLGGLFHGLSHHGPDQGEPHAACQLCAAYASFDHGTTSASVDIPPLAGVSPRTEARSDGLARRALLAFHSRAPPVNA